ncbi:MAG: prolyl oligopeptidase family serine peptidase [Lentisphaerota bacterium]
MKKYDVTFESVSSYSDSKYASACKEITAFIIEPDIVNEQTGAMLFLHGWDCNRFMDKELMEFTADAYNVICISPEYRQSGYDFNARTGKGFCSPYDLSFYQVIDSLGALRHVLSVRSNLNRKRIFAYGISQGGHIALLASIFAPDTFAFINAVAPLVQVRETQAKLAGRDFSEDELSIRNVLEHAERIRCPVFFEHGTADETLPHDEHSVLLEARLKKLGKEYIVKYHEGGGHLLTPAISRLQALKDMLGDKISRIESASADDFITGTLTEIKCKNKKLVIDWSREQTASKLFYWSNI